jgi:TolB-like protein/predicted Ser/Thr protein kinase
MALAAGARLGPYEIQSALGAGGMGEVYRARDTRLGRDVAVKVISPSCTGDPDRLRRFQQEARTIAAVSHPHICQIYDVGPDYLVLEYLDGVPLRGPMPASEAVRLALQIASALEAAHARGILHRDLKPANIMVTREGTARLLDFGLAKLMGSPEGGPEDLTRTVEGTVLGTAAYMSPEQAEGKPLDTWSDIFSFGTVLYELLSGNRAFAGTTTLHVLNAVLREEPAPLPAPAVLVDIVRRCLQKRPEHRFQTMTDLRMALERAAQDLASAKTADQQPSIAVLPFANLSADPENEYFSDGLAEDIINALTHVPGLKVIARTSAFSFKGKQEDVRRIAEALGVTNVLEGSVRRAGSRIRVTAQLIAAADGSHVWSERYDRELTDVFAIQDEIAEAIAAVLRVKLAAKPVDIRRHTPDLPAYDAFLRGRHHLFKGTPDAIMRAKACFEEAIALDPLYARPWAALTLGHFMASSIGVQPLHEVAPQLRAEALKALELDPTEPSPHALLGVIAAAHDYDWNEAARQFGAAMDAIRVSPDTRWLYAVFYLGALGRFRESAAELERAVEEDPLNVPWRVVFARHLENAEMHGRALDEVLKARDLDENHWLPHCMLAETYVALGRLDEAIAEGEVAHRAARWHSMPTGVLAAALARAGQKGPAEDLIAEMGDAPRPIWGRVLYHLLCSEIDSAADWSERMIDHREPLAVFAQMRVGRALRQSVRWPKLARMMNLPTEP